MASSAPFFFLFGLTLFIALLAAIFPLPPGLSVVRPEWICLLMIYWSLYTPHHVGIGVAWSVGFVQDIVEGTVWGGHAFALALVTYVCLTSYRRLRSYSTTQQAFWVVVLVGLHQLFVNWFQGLDGYAGPANYMLFSALVTAAFWPLLVLLLRRLQRQYRIF